MRARKTLTKLEKSLEYAWMGLNLNDPSLYIHNPLTKDIRKDENPITEIFRYMRDPRYFFFTVKTLFGMELFPFQLVMLRELWIRAFPMVLAARGGSKSQMLALYIMLRLMFTQGARVCVVGSAFRQSKVVFEYCEDLWARGHLYRDIVTGEPGRGGRKNGPHKAMDRWEIIVGQSIVTFLPLGDGKKIRGQRAHYLVAEEFSTINVEVYQKVVEGFGSVSASPVDNVKIAARIEMMKEMGMWTDEAEKAQKPQGGNQSIVCGTCDYEFNHFYKYFLQYKAIIESKGEKEKLNEIFSGEIPDKFNYADYSIIRLPYNILPKHYMDERQMSRFKATFLRSQFLMEYGACFIVDSEGFFKRSLIETCVVGRPDNEIIKPSVGDEPINFHAALVGSQNVRHIIAIDPASEEDNFSIVIIACYPDHRRVVYCWTMTRRKFKQKLKKGDTQERDFYQYCSRKIRDLMKMFPCERVVIDRMGGGIAIIEALGDNKRLKPGEQPLYILPEDDKDELYSFSAGLHIIKGINFSDPQWTSYANHTLKKDMEDKVLLFPYFDSAYLGLAIQEDVSQSRDDDTLEDAMFNIEEMKKELTTIVYSRTANSREKWTLPVSAEGKKRKDRYSALLMGNSIARDIDRFLDPTASYKSGGGWAINYDKDTGGGRMYYGPEWLKDAHSSTYGAIVRH